MSNEHDSRENLSRRGVLKGTAALASTAAISGEAGAYRDAFDFRMPVAQNDGEGRTFTLTGIVGGWLGVAPHEIDGQSNPPLRLVEGETHEVVWVNGDGSMHNFNICSGSAVAEDVEVLEATETVTEQGEFTSLEFTATEEMDEYFCMPHPAQMRGPIELVDPGDVHELVVHVEDENGDPLGAEVYLDDMHSFSDLAARPDPFTEDGQSEESEEAEPGDEGGDGDGEGEQEEAPSIARFDMLEDGEYELEVWTYGYERVTETVEIDGEDTELTVTLSAVDPGEPTETYSMRLEEGQWVGVEPDAIADATNPTLDLEAGETYAIEWENAIGRHQPEAENRTYEPLPGHNLAIASNGETTDWNTYVRSNFTAEEGATQTVEFVAEEEMALYLDQSQLEAVGEISVGGQSGEAEPSETETAETSGNETVTVDGNETAETDGNETAAVDGNETETVEVDGDETAAVDGNETVETDSNETAETDDNETAEVDGNETAGD